MSHYCDILSAKGEDAWIRLKGGYNLRVRQAMAIGPSVGQTGRPVGKEHEST